MVNEVLGVVGHFAIVEIQYPGEVMAGRILTTRPVPAFAKLVSACF